MPKPDDSAHKELLRLECELRKMRLVYPDEPRKQKAIKQLVNEKNDLLNVIDLTRTQFIKTFTSQCSQDVLLLFNEYKLLGQKNLKKREDLAVLEMGISKVKGQIDVLQKNVLEVGEMNEKGERAKCTVASQLYTATIALNKKTFNNDKILRDVESLLIERDRYSKHYDKMAAELRTGEKIINDIIEQSNVTYDSRKEAHKKLLSLKSKTESSFQSNCFAAQDISRNVDHITRRNEFMIVKKKQRNVCDFDVTSESDVTDRSDVVGAGGETSNVENIEQYSTVLKQVQDELGEGSLKQLVPKVVKLGNDNHSCYTYINEVNKKLVSMCDEVRRLHRDIETKRQIHSQEEDDAALLVAKTSEDLSAKKENVLHLKECLGKVKHEENALFEKIKIVFDSVGGNSEEITRMLGPNSTISRDNYEFYLKALEKRLHELAFVLRYQMDTAPGIAASFHLEKLKTHLPSSPCPLCAEIKDLSELDETVVVPRDIATMRMELRAELKKGERMDLLHSVAECRLPKSRRIIQTGEMEDF